MNLSKFFKFSLPIGIAGIVINIILFITNLFYELVVPVIENTSLEGAVFTFFDDLIFYTPCIFMVLFAAYMIAGFIYKRKHLSKVEDKVTEELNEKNEAIQKALDEKEDFLKYKLHTNCPNCGAPRAKDEKECSFCGASLVIEKRKSLD